MTGTLRNSLILLLAGVLTVTLLYAAADDMEPDGDISTGWNEGTGNTFAEIDEGADTHDGHGPGGTAIAESGNNIISEFTFEATPGDFGSLNSLTVKIAHQRTGTGDDNPNFDVLVFDNVPTQIGGTKTSTSSDGSFTVESFTDAAWDSMTQAQLDGMRVRVVYHVNQTGMPDGTWHIDISAITAELDYNAAAARSRVVDIQ